MANFAKKKAVKRQRVVTLDKEYGFTLFHKWMVINCCTLMTDNEEGITFKDIESLEDNHLQSDPCDQQQTLK